MKNYIYFQKSTEQVKVGDLTKEGIIIEIDEGLVKFMHGLILIEESLKHLNLIPLLPMLIMDAPEINDEPIGKNLKFYQQQWTQTYLKTGITVNNNKDVWNWLKPKGITPEIDGLYEFDGEVEILEIPCESWCRNEYKCNPDDPIICKNPKKVAIIKDAGESEDEQDKLWGIVFKLGKIEGHYDFSILKKNFKIERR